MVKFDEGLKVSILIKEKRHSIKVNGKVCYSNNHFVVIDNKKYKTCINLIDFETGHAVLV